MRRLAIVLCGVLATEALLPGDAGGQLFRRPRCAPDQAAVGPVCVDKCEASVWDLPADPVFVRRATLGRLSLDELRAAGARQLGVIPRDGCTGDEYGSEFPRNGHWRKPLYALSVAGALPSTCITWFQAEQACRLAGKRLLTNQEWQAAVAGTADPNDADDQSTTCVTAGDFAAPSGSRAKCVSQWGVYDLVGNVWEWVADWINPAMGCQSWPSEYGSDISCMGMVPVPEPTPSSFLARWFRRELVSFEPNLPGAIIRGGNFATGARNGAFAVFAGVNPHNVSRSTGFRCAR